MSEDYRLLRMVLENAILDSAISTLMPVQELVNKDAPPATIAAAVKAAFVEFRQSIPNPDKYGAGVRADRWEKSLECNLREVRESHVKRIEAIIQDLKSDKEHAWPDTIAKLEEGMKQVQQGILPLNNIQQICVYYENRGPAAPNAAEVGNVLDDLVQFLRDPKLLEAIADDSGRQRVEDLANRIAALSEGGRNGAYDMKLVEGKFDLYVETLTPYIPSSDTQTKLFQEKIARFRTALREPSKVAQATVPTAAAPKKIEPQKPEPQKPEPKKPERIINWNEDLLKKIPAEYRHQYERFSRSDLETVLEREQQIEVKVKNFRVALDYLSECFEHNPELKEQFGKIRGRNLELPKQHDQRALAGLQLPRIQKEVVQFMRANDRQIKRFLMELPQEQGKALAERINYLKKYLEASFTPKAAASAATKASNSAPEPMDPKLKQAIAGSHPKTDQENLPPTNSGETALKSETQSTAAQPKKAAAPLASRAKDPKEQNVKYFRKALDYLSESLPANSELKLKFDSLPGRHLVMPWRPEQRGMAELHLPKIRERVLQFMKENQAEIKQYLAQGSPEFSKQLSDRIQYLENYMDACVAARATQNTAAVKAVSLPPAPLAPKLKQMMEAPKQGLADAAASTRDFRSQLQEANKASSPELPPRPQKNV